MQGKKIYQSEYDRFGEVLQEELPKLAEAMREAFDETNPEIENLMRKVVNI